MFYLLKKIGCYYNAIKNLWRIFLWHRIFFFWSKYQKLWFLKQSKFSKLKKSFKNIRIILSFFHSLKKSNAIKKFHKENYGEFFIVPQIYGLFNCKKNKKKKKKSQIQTHEK